MENYQSTNTCTYNILYVQFNEDFERSKYFSYDVKYPVIYNIRNQSTYVNPVILNNINNAVRMTVNNFKNGLQEEEREYNNAASQNSLPKQSYWVSTSYAVTFNKNYVLSMILNLMGFANNYGPKYNTLNNYNIDLTTGKELLLNDIFRDGVDYINIITEYIKSQINENREMYYSNVELVIPEDQAFYLTDNGIIIYFGVDEIAPESFGIPKFELKFSDFGNFINLRFYCISPDIYVQSRGRAKHFMG